VASPVEHAIEDGFGEIGTVQHAAPRTDRLLVVDRLLVLKIIGR
jgi:hypothetical protein